MKTFALLIKSQLIHNTVLPFLLIFSLGHDSFGQNLTQIVKGRIIDEQSKIPMMGATVIIKNTTPQIGGITDTEGYFRISDVPIGRQTLEVSSVGYENRSVPDVLIKSGKELVLDIEIKESVVKIGELIITASSQNKGKVLNEMATISAFSFSTEETSRYPATFEDPARAATSFAGVTVGGEDLYNQIVIRGNTPKGLLWRLEGVEIPNPNHFSEYGSSAGGISMFSSNLLSNSDFYTGAFPAQFGNASSGVFDLKLRKGNYDKRETTLQAGLFGLAVAAEGPISKKSKSSYLFNYRYSTLAVLSAIGIDLLPPTEKVGFQDLSFKIHIPSKKLGSISLWALGGDNYSSDEAAPSNAWFFNERADQSIGVIGLTNINYLGKNTFVETILSATSSRYKFSSDSIDGRRVIREQFNEHTYRVSSLINHKISSRHTFRIGGIYSYIGYDMFDRRFLIPGEPPSSPLSIKSNGSVTQAFVQWQFRPNDKWSINPGFHLTYFNINEDLYPEPRLGVEYSLNAKNKLTAGFGTHSRREAIAIYRSQKLQEDGSYTELNQNLGFTQANHYVLGYEKMLKTDLRFKTEVYYQGLYNVPISHPGSVENEQYPVFSVLNLPFTSGYTNDQLSNDGTGINYGIELGIEKFFSNNLYYLTNISLYESKFKGRDQVLRNTMFNGNYVFNFVGGREVRVGPNKNNLLNINIKLIAAGGQRYIPFDLEASNQDNVAVQDFTRAFDDQLKDYKRVDIGINYRINKEKSSSIIDFSIQNVFNIRNEFGRTYDPDEQRVVSDLHLGIVPNINYKFEF